MMRLSKYLQQCGVGSRREAEELIAANQVKINDRVVYEPFTQVNEGDIVTVNGKIVKLEETKAYYLLNKPKGLENILTLFTKLNIRLFTVGKMDIDAEGLIILTNDGEFSLKISSPYSKVEKEYLVEVDQPLADNHLKIISMGKVVDGSFASPLLVEKLDDHTLKIVVEEGKRREIRYLLSDSGLHATSIKRVRIGPLKIEDLESGQYKAFNPDCFNQLKTD